MEQDSIGNVEVSEAVGNFRIIDHAPPYECHLTIRLKGKVNQQLNPVNGAGKAGNKNAVLGSIKNLLQPLVNSALGGRVAGALRVCAVGKQRQNAALAVLGERVEIEQFVVRGRRIHFEVSGVQNHTQRRCDRQHGRTDDAMRDVDELDVERP